MKYCRTCSATYLAMSRCPRDGTPVSAEGGDPLLGQVLGGRYRVLERMAAGGMGQVYRASHVRIASLCAVKVLYGDLASDGEMSKRFEREAEAASALQSRYITRVLDFGETGGGLPYLAMELLSGLTLSAAIARAGALDEARVVRIARRLLVGLAHAHERGVVHRDLKPDNVMLVSEDDEDDVPKILDFGIARVRASPGVTMAGQVMGTPEYMAPEQFFASDVDARADLYSLGIVLFEMLSGRAPFEARTPMAAREQHLTAPLPALEREVSAGLNTLLGRLLEKKADDRPASAREVIEALDALGKARREGPTLKSKNPLLAVARRRSAEEMIRGAIQKGAPLYNAGDVKGCAALYRSTAEELIALELGETPEALRARLQAAMERADGAEPSRAAWELRYAFDDLLFALTRPTTKREPVADAASRFAAGCAERVGVVRVLDQAALIAARRYEAGQPEVVADFYRVLALALTAQLRSGRCCVALVARLDAALEAAEDAPRGAEAATLLGAAFDEVRFEAAAGEFYEVPPAEAAVVANSEQIDEVADALVRAIGTGAVWYNAGDVDGCARLYAQTCERVLGGLKAVQRNAALKKLLAGALEKSKGQGADERAWTFRHAFDAVLEAQRVAKAPSGVSAVGGKKRG
ncbi:MAG: serine/threonine protein kinase [Myxococcaceae bacterium]|nr:serine/threonine protein kinase [Myxococcaceae bacterium]